MFLKKLRDHVTNFCINQGQILSTVNLFVMRRSRHVTAFKNISSPLMGKDYPRAYQPVAKFRK